MIIVRPGHILAQKWDKLKLREKALVYLMCKRRYTQKEIMKKLYIDNDRTFRALRARTRKKLR